MRVETQRLIKQADRDLENAAKNVGIAAFEVTAEAKVRAAEEAVAWIRCLMNG